MKFLRILMIDMKRAIFSWRFLFSVMAMAALIPISVGTSMGDRNDTVFYLLTMLVGSGMEGLGLLILPVFAFGLSYASEYREGADRLLIARVGCSRYITSKIIMCAVSGFATVFMGMVIFIILAGITHPLYRLGESHTYFQYAELIAEGMVLKGYLLYMLHMGLAGAVASVCALWLSALKPNVFFAATAPFLLYFTIARITSGMQLPGWIDPLYWCAVYEVGTVGSTILARMAVSLVLCTVMGMAASYHIKRRLRNE